MTSASASSSKGHGVSAKSRPSSTPVLDFSQCKGVKQGPVFLIASGKSAKDFPIQEFSDVPMITMNGAIAMLAQKGINPFFYVCTDRDFANQQPHLYATAMRTSENVAVWGDQLKTDKPKPRGRAFALKKSPRASLVSSLFRRESTLVRKRSLLSKRSKDIGFSKDLGQGFFDARTVMYLALQVAYHLGFNKVFLVGFDLNQSAGRFYENCNAKRSPCGLDQHFETRILPSLELMSAHVVDENFQAYNLSAVSRVPEDVIPKVSIEDARKMLEAYRDSPPES
ncbi:lipopolysaccharide biosynthesis protein [Pseudomonas sp. R1-18]|uniref:lipopolysaccharide biosynthesis protein n=1 Tax=Pseudomonas sp. R1-18 TaxID=1632772 RepID=UPI003DA807C5